MRSNAIKPEIDGPHYAYPCTCGHRVCKAWFVSGACDMQGVSLQKREAAFVANMLNALEAGGDSLAAELVAHAKERISL